MRSTLTKALSAGLLLTASCVAHAGFFGPFDPPTQVPEPSALFLLAAGVAGIAIARRIRKNKK